VQQRILALARHGRDPTEDVMKRSGSAVWNGGLKDGKGVISTQTRVLDNTPYTFSGRFEQGSGTNPEELVAAAHAGCFSMALSGELNAAGFTAKSIRTEATATLEKTDAGWTVTEMHLDVTAEVPNATPEAFEQAAENAKRNCPISRLLNTKVTKEARLGAGTGATA
jgi:osmotically inducible protein OsmC